MQDFCEIILVKLPGNQPYFAVKILKIFTMQSVKYQPYFAVKFKNIHNARFYQTEYLIETFQKSNIKSNVKKAHH